MTENEIRINGERIGQEQLKKSLSEMADLNRMFHKLNSFKVLTAEEAANIPEGTRIYSMYMVYRYKPNKPFGLRCKARAVIIGNRHNAKKEERYSPSVSDQMQKTSWALAFYFGLTYCVSFDFISAFCQVPYDSPSDFKYFRTAPGMTDEHGVPYPPGTLIVFMKVNRCIRIET